MPQPFYQRRPSRVPFQLDEPHQTGEKARPVPVEPSGRPAAEIVRTARASRCGSILILTVWIITLLSLLVMGLGSRGAFALGTTDRLAHQLEASYLALAGAQRVITILGQDPTSYDGLNDEWATGQIHFGWQTLGGGSFAIRPPALWAGAPTTHPASSGITSSDEAAGLVDEDRKLNLNTAPTEILQRLLEVAGELSEEEALGIAEAIEDWHDADQRPRQEGAEDFYYLGLNPPYECKDSEFEHPEELLLVKGMTPALFTRVAPYVTVYGSGRVNLNTADPVVLQALGLSEEAIAGIGWYRAGDDNETGTADDRVLTSLTSVTAELASVVPVEDLNRLAQWDHAGLLGVRSEAFSFLVIAQTQRADRQVHLSCVVDRAGQIKAWTER